MFDNLWKPGDKLFGEEGDEGLTEEQRKLLESLETPNSSAQSNACCSGVKPSSPSAPKSLSPGFQNDSGQKLITILRMQRA